MAILPKVIHLRAMNKRWKVSYVQSTGKLVLIEHPHRELVVYGRKYSKRAALDIIIRWVRLKADAFLLGMLKKANQKVKVKVKVKKVRIGSHHAQWGSSTECGEISLNYKLIFLPAALANHIIIHELCHVRYFSHSKEFWAELAKYDKQSNKNRKAMDDTDKYMPAWLIF